MTLDETIKEAKVMSVIYENEARKCTQHDDLLHKEKARAFGESAKEFEQIAKWLEELKAYREVYGKADRPQGKWITKTVKKLCAPDCWYPGIFVIEGSWNEEEGSWLEEQDGFCSECGKQDEHHNSHKYCPNCGAKMKGVNDE